MWPSTIAPWRAEEIDSLQVSFIPRFPVRRSGALQQTFYGSALSSKVASLSTCSHPPAKMDQCVSGISVIAHREEAIICVGTAMSTCSVSPGKMCIVRAFTYSRASAGHGGNICSRQDHCHSIATSRLASAYDISYM